MMGLFRRSQQKSARGAVGSELASVRGLSAPSPQWSTNIVDRCFQSIRDHGIVYHTFSDSILSCLCRWFRREPSAMMVSGRSILTIRLNLQIRFDDEWTPDTTTVAQFLRQPRRPHTRRHECCLPSWQSCRLVPSHISRRPLRTKNTTLDWRNQLRCLCLNAGFFERHRNFYRGPSYPRLLHKFPRTTQSHPN